MTKLEKSAATTRCPFCGSEIWVDGGQVRCIGEACQASGFSRPSDYHHGLLIDWSNGAKKEFELPILKKGLALVDPLASPASPLTWARKRMVETYYSRISTDSELATRFVSYYFQQPDIRGLRVLDHGAGRGRVGALVAMSGAQVDIQDTYLHDWWHSFQFDVGQVVPANATHLPWESSRFDAVCSFGVVSFFSDSGLRQLAQEVARVLKPGGCWIVWDANGQSNEARHQRRFAPHLRSPSQVSALVREAGLEVGVVDYEGRSRSRFPRLRTLCSNLLDWTNFDYQCYGRKYATDETRHRMFTSRFSKPTQI